MQILSKTEIKGILRILDKQFGFKEKLDYIFLKSPKDKIFIINQKFKEFDFKNFNLNNIGLYFAKIEKDGIRLSIEGSQIIGPKTNKNILVLDSVQEWLTGKNVDVKTDLKGYVVVKYGEDFIGCSKIKKNKLLNYIPKGRRILDIAPS